MKKLLVIFPLLFAFYAALALDLRSGDQVTLEETVYSDMYIGAGEISIDAPVYGDLFIGGGDISINDTIFEDLVIGGGNIEISGYVGDDVRIAGGDITITGNVQGDIILFGGNLVIRSDSIGGDVILFGGDLDANSSIGGGVSLYGGSVKIDGLISGDLEGKCGDLTIESAVFGNSRLIAEHITLSPGAAFHNDVVYWSEQGEVDFSNAMISGTATYDEGLRNKISGDSEGSGSFMKMGMLMFFWSFLGGILLIILLHVLFKQIFLRAGALYQDNLLVHFFYGFLFYVVTPIIILIAFMTIIGIPAAAIILMCYLIIAVLTTAGASLILANWINQKWNKNWSSTMIVLIAIVALLLLKILNLIPFVGWLITIIVCWAALGSLIRLVLQRKTATGNV